jgi:NAD(P)H-hydrate epimerase
MDEQQRQLLSNAQMAAADAAAIASGMSLDQLMEAAGRAVADETPPGNPVLVLCGPGNNGGDGFVAARLLAAAGRTVRVFADGPPKGAAARSAATLWAGDISPLAAFHPEAGCVVIDALFGAGLTGPITGPAAAAIARLNAAGCNVLSVDVPSGVDGDTGQQAGIAVQATTTVCFFRARPGHWLWPGRALRGALRIRDIGLTPAHLAGQAPFSEVNTPALWRSALPEPGTEAHKYRRGHCLVISGPALQTGAARLAATGALNAGAGAVTLTGDREALLVQAHHVTAIMLRETADAAALAALVAEGRHGSAVIGPAAGLGDVTSSRMAALLASEIALVLDADAITMLARQPELRRLRDNAAPMVLTPHAGEFERLFAGRPEADPAFAALPARLKESKLETARAAARLCGAILVLKGVDTVIAAPDGRVAINANAGPELATAGSGDVLAGIIGAHLAQGMPGFEAAAAGVWLHAHCGGLYGVGLTADRLVARVRPLVAFSQDIRA